MSRAIAILIGLISLVIFARGQTPTPTPGYSESDSGTATPPAKTAHPVSVETLQKAIKDKKYKDIITAYDKFKDQSILMTKPFNLIGSWEGGMAIVSADMAGPMGGGQTVLLMNVGYAWKGSNLNIVPESFVLTFNSMATKWTYLKGDNNVYILADDARIELHPAAKDNDIAYGLTTATADEQISFVISRGDLQRVASAKKVELRLGDSKPRTLKPEWSKRFQTFLDITKLDP